VGVLVYLAALPGLANADIRIWAVATMMAGGSLVFSGFPVEQPRWWALLPEMMLIYKGLEVSRIRPGIGPLIVLGMFGVGVGLKEAAAQSSEPEAHNPDN